MSKTQQKQTASSRSKQKPPRAGELGSVSVDLKDLPIVIDSSIKTIWVDRTQLHVRGEPEIGMLRFGSLIPPDTLVEVCRIQTTTNHLKGIAEIICHALDYYPKRPGAKASKA